MAGSRDWTIRVPPLILFLLFSGYCVVLHYQLRVLWPCQENVSTEHLHHHHIPSCPA